MQRNWFTKTRVLCFAVIALLVVAEDSWAQRGGRRAARRSGGSYDTPVTTDYYSPSMVQYGQYGQQYGQYATQGSYQNAPTVTVTATYQYVTQQVVQSSGGRGRRGGGSYMTTQTVPVLVSYSTSPATTTTQTPQTALLPTSDPRRAFYPPEQAVQAAIIDMRLPAGAEVFFDGQRTTQIGTLRQYVTPPLQGDRTFTYEVRARWLDQNGQVVDQTRQVRITAGGRILVDFLTPANTATGIE